VEDGGRKVEDGGYRTEGGGRRVEDGGWRVEDGSKNLPQILNRGLRLPEDALQCFRRN